MTKWLNQIIYPKNFWILLFVSFLSIWGYGAQRVIAPVQMKLTGDDIFFIGLYLSLFGLPRAIMNIIGGHLSDKFSKRYNMVFSLFLFGVISIFFIGISESSFSLGMWRVMMGIGLSWGTTAMLAYLSDITEPTIRGTAFGLQKMTTWIGMALSSFFAPLFLNFLGMSLLMIVMSSLSAFSVLLVYFFLNDIPKQLNSVKSFSRKRIEDEHTDELLLKQVKRLKIWEKIILSYNGLIMKMIEDGIITFFIPIYIYTHYQDFVSIGLVISIYTAIYVVSQPLGGILADYLGSSRVMFYGLLINSAAIMLLYYMEELILFYIFSILTGIGSGVVVTSGEMRASIIGVEGSKSRTLGIWRFYRDMGSFFGPLLVGIVLSIGNEILFVNIMAVILLLAILLMLVYFYAAKIISSVKKEENTNIS